jgi:hypothetical protein
MIDMAEESLNYSSDDIEIMKGIATDVSQPVMAYNGDYIQHVGSNPSGQNLTVYINSIVNALLFRCAYYHTYKDREDLPDFNEVCSLITYGDDAKSSVHELFPEFNHITVAKFLEERDMKFTMPDKESVATEYMDAEEADFLKRSNFYHPDLKANVGVLSEDSIFKRLHAHLQSKDLSLEMQSAQNIDTSLHDWFYYGRETFECRLSEMQDIASQAGITHLCQGFDKNYEDRVQDWLRKYRPEDAEPVSEARITFRESY